MADTNPFTNPFAPIAPPSAPNTGGGKIAQPTAPGTTPWPLSIQLQAQAIAAAIAQYSVPQQVFMGMYSNETSFGFLRNADGSIQTSPAGAIGPFQFIGQKTGIPHYPMTSTPNFFDFIDQANAAAAYLKQLYKQSSPTSWHWALAAYNAGPGNAGAGYSYATQAMAVQIPLNWQAWLGKGPALPGGIAGAGGHGTLVNAAGVGLTSGFTVGDPANPDEDYWTAMNRLSQERYWYSAHITTPVATPNGWKTLENIEVGDFVFGANGQPIRVTRVFPVYHDRSCLRVTFRNGDSIITDAEHRWTTSQGTLSTAEVAVSVTTPSSAGRKYPRYNHHIAATDPLVLPEADLPLDPYLLGYWLGDGTSSQPRITVGSDDRDHVQAAIAGAQLDCVTYPHHSPGSYQVVFRTGHTGRGHRGPLRELNVLDNKHIPSVYLRASYEQRLALLQGLMDSDGWVGRTSCVFANVNARLADDVRELLRTLGCMTHRVIRKGGRTIRMPQGHTSVARDVVNIKFATTPDFCPFLLPRKVVKYNAVRDRLTFHRPRRHTIVTVEPTESVPVRCIEVDSSDHLFLIGKSLIPTHNCFSDGETLYLADGPDLMKQTPAAKLDRIGNLDQINHLDFVWDNTAWQYTATHKKRKRAQRRTSLAKVTSPVEATLDLVCAIDECRAGDVVSFTNTGPGDGDWLVGTCRRSVFEVLSQINMVVALTPLTEGELNPAGINKNNLSSQLGGLGGGTGKYKGYVNPVGNWAPNRIDAGVDGTLTSPYLAPGDSHILVADASNAGWKGGGYIAGRLENGPLKGLIWYVAEGITPLVPNGAVVKAGTPVGRLATSPYGNSYGHGAWGAIETGWANPAAPAQPQGFVGNSDDQGPRAIAFGNSFNRFLTKLGANPGALQGRGVNVAPGPLPAGYP